MTIQQYTQLNSKTPEELGQKNVQTYVTRLGWKRPSDGLDSTLTVLHVIILK